MADVVGVVFHNGVKVYYFDPAGLELSRGDRVVVQTSKGSEIGQVVEPPHAVDDSEIQAQLKKVTRIATGRDLEAQASDEQVRREAMATCRELIESHGLDMKLVGADIGFGGEKITISFYSDERVDFRALVADLAKALQMRIELRQVGAREEARMVGGLGPCGRNLCCTMFAGDDDPVSIRMAKEQNLPLNPMKISGLCGRLMCCLKYEQDQYVSFRKEAPSRGTSISTPTGDAVVVGYNVPKDAITVKYEDGSVGDIRLAGCQCREGGGLMVVPEEELEPVEAFGDGSELEAIGDDERVAEGLAVVEAEVVTGDDGEPVPVIVSDGSRRSKGRRGRRGGKRRTKTPVDDQAGTAGSGESPGASGDDGSGHRRGHKPPRHSHRKGETRPEDQREGAGSLSAEKSDGEGSSGTGSGRSRRRRKRRPSSGAGTGSGQAGGSQSGGEGSRADGGGQGGGEGAQA